jgi:biofilm PGA synthesis protein PgaD
MRIRDWLLSILMWAVYVSLIREALIDLYLLITGTFRWLFLGASRPDLPIVFQVLHTIGIYGEVIAFNAAILICWALYNRYRFRGRDQRKRVGAVGHDDLGQLYGFSADEIARWQAARSLILVHDDAGTLIAGEPEPPPTVRPAKP